MLKRIFAGSILALGLVGCGGSGSSSGTAYVYGVNAISNLGSLSITANGTTILNGAPYQTGSPSFVPVNSGANVLLYLTNSSNTQLASGSTTFGTGGYYTAFALGNATNQYLFEYQANTTAPSPTSSGTATGNLIFVNASIAQPSLDVYITLSGGTQATTPNIPSLTPFTAGAAAEVTGLVTGTYDVQFKVAGTSTVVVDEPSVAIATSSTNAIQIVGVSDSVPSTGATTQAALPLISVPAISSAKALQVRSHPIVIGHPNMTSFPKN